MYGFPVSRQSEAHDGQIDGQAATPVWRVVHSIRFQYRVTERYMRSVTDKYQKQTIFTGEMDTCTVAIDHFGLGFTYISPLWQRLCKKLFLHFHSQNPNLDPVMA